MNKEQIQALLETLQKLFEVSMSKESIINVLQQHPELLSKEADMMMDRFIQISHEQGNEEDVKFFSHYREMLQSIRLNKTQKNQNKNIPSQFRDDLNQAISAKKKYQQEREVQYLDEAIAAWERILNHTDFYCVDEKFRLAVLNDSATIYLHRYWVKGIIKDLNKALSFWKETVKLAPKNSQNLPKYLNNLGNVLRECYISYGNISDLSEAIKNSQKAVKLTSKDSSELPGYLNNLGNCYLDRYVHLGDPIDLNKAIKIHNQSVKLTSENSSELPMFLNNLGNGFFQHYTDYGDISSLDKSIKNYQKAVILTTKNSVNLPGRLNNLGNSFHKRYIKRNNFYDLLEAIKNYRQAIKFTEINSPDLPLYLNNLGASLRSRYIHIHLEDINDFNESIENIKKAIILAEKNSPNLSMYLNNLGNSFIDQYARLNKLQDLNEAIKNYSQAVKLTPKNSPNLVGRLNNIGTGFSNRYTLLNDLNDLNKGIKNYQQGAEMGLKVALGHGLENAKNWLNWAFNRQSWNEVQQAYNFAYQASTRLVQTQLTRQHQESWLKDTQGLAAHVAYAFAKQKQFQEAVITLERGLAQLLSEALARDKADLEQLKTQGYTDLYNRYQQAVEAWHNAKYVKKELVYERLQEARKELDETITAIRKVENYTNFLMPPEFADIVTAVKNSTIIYLLTTKAGGLALIINKDEKITPVWLQELTEELLQPILDNYLQDQNNCSKYPQDNTYKQKWLNTLESTTNILWKQIMAPLIQALPKQEQITLIPVGHLGLLPLHAAWTEDKNTSTGKRYSLDELTISYVPNARSLIEARKIANQVTVDRLLAINEPKPVKASDLPSSEYEVQTITTNFAQHQIFKHEAATRQAILDNLTKCNVLHFSCHGFADLNKPLKSGLMMANNEPLTVKDFLDLHLKGIRLATLSACETGIPGMELPDEVVNLPAGLLQAGVAGVVASLWSVSDMSTALLMAKFYQNVIKIWQQQGTQSSIVPALNEAQRWLRDATTEELKQWVKELPIDATQKRELRRLFNTPQIRPYENSYYWAAFSAIGV
ncbi:MAG: CHAT domain-containing protein [Candidatus Marithrix sp.]